MELSHSPAGINIPKFLSGGGEMSKLIGEYNWSATSIGAIDTWPQSLKTALNILLKSKFPMMLWWGKDLVQFYNDAYRPILGYEGKHPKALGQQCKDCWIEAWDFIEPLVEKVFNDEAVWYEDMLVPIFRNGSMEDVYWTFSYSPVNDEDGNVSGVFVVCNETTPQVNAINTIKQSEERFQNLIREATVGIVVLTGEEMKVEIVNAMYGRLINKSPEELMGKPLFSIIPEVADPFLGILLDVLKTGKPIYLYDQTYFIYANGEKKTGYVNVVYQPYKDAEGTIIGVMALCHDITEQVLNIQKVAEAEAKARLAIESASLGTYEIDYATDKMITSERFDAIWGIDHSLPRPAIAGVIHPDDIPVRKEAHELSLITGNLHYEARIIWQDGSHHWVRVKGKVLYDDKGTPTTLLGVVQDINEQKLFAEQLTSLVKERTLELERSNEDLMQFAHVTSHDLKEPVRKIKLYNGRLQHEYGSLLPERGISYLDKVQHAADRMFSMIDGVLKYSALSSSDQAIETVDLNKLIENIKIDLEVMISQKNAAVVTNELPQIQGATVLIYQLFYNIINNALKFSRADVSPLISLSSSFIDQDGIKMAQVHVADNGIGFSQEYEKKIFNTFARLNSKDEFEGTGLGLALCKKITDRHKGSITAKGVKNEGAVFTISLPLVHASKQL